MPTHRVTLSRDHRAYSAFACRDGWELVLSTDDIDGQHSLLFVTCDEVLLVRVLA